MFNPDANADRDNGAMNLPVLTKLTAKSQPITSPHDWARLRDAALAGDMAAAARLFATAARWANRLTHTFVWLDDPEADVLAVMWETLCATTIRSSDHWRQATLRRLRRRRCYQPDGQHSTLTVAGNRRRHRPATISYPAATRTIEHAAARDTSDADPEQRAVLRDEVRDHLTKLRDCSGSVRQALHRVATDDVDGSDLAVLAQWRRRPPAALRRLDRIA